ncbi:hypothetical protein BT93_B0534 [Corymbia citriodora subsp. variegata]|nr:hypothetical protein BT93_B0534 [Corymbia citriodora subsp. variegata]
MEADWSCLHVLANASELVRDRLLSVCPAAQTRPSELPEIFWDKMQEMHGQDVMLVLEKRLSATDVKRHASRLSIPMGQMRASFLTGEEIRALGNKEEIAVSLIEPCLHVRHGLQLRKWNHKRDNFSYVLAKEWTDVAHPFERNGLEMGCLVRLWSFRTNGDLCFCLVNVEAPPPDAVENMANLE